jgi:hypothetical protein
MSKLENNITVINGDKKATLSTNVVHCTYCGFVMLFSRDQLPENKFSS